MLPENNRICKSSQFQQLFKKGKVGKSNHFKAYFLLKAEETNPKIGIITSKKVGNAVLRNRSKRLMREIIRAHLKQILPNVNIVFVMFDSSANASFQTLKESTTNFLIKNQLLK